MPTPRCGLSTSVVDGKIYAIGGRAGGQFYSTVEEYDPVTDTWTRKADMPLARSALSTSVVNGKIYAIGGAGLGDEDPTAIVEEYDPATDTWRRRSPMGAARANLSTSVVNGKIYAIGGLTRASTGVLPTIVEEYDPATDTWRARMDMPTGRANLSTSVVDGKIYAIGGSYWTGVSNVFSAVEEYDPATHTWRAKADMPAPRDYLSSSVVDGIIYSIGGLSRDEAYLATVAAYDPATDTWTPIPDMMPTARAWLSTSVIDGRIYAIGGWPGPWPQVTGATEEYDLTPFPPDFNGDGMVDIKDLLRLIESWGQSDPAADIGPRPFGDGIVDAADLEVLMGYWGQQVNDPALTVHWALDETEGAIAYDSVGSNDALVLGDAVWQPDAGKAGGALAFDGVDDSVVAGAVPSLADGPFSILAWVKGGVPGQAILSLQGGVRWLYTDPIDGSLMTDLSRSSRMVQPLSSDVVVTDGQWHRIALVWDGADRILCVDDEEATREPLDGVSLSGGKLIIGGGGSMQAGSLWSGLIDDVRIYNRPVRP